MKIFLKNIGTCALNYQHFIFEDVIPEYAELTNNSREADIIIFSGTCACTELSIICAIGEMKEILNEVKPSARVYMTGCLTRTFTKSDRVIDKAIDWIKLNIDEIIPQNQPLLLFEKLFGLDISDEYVDFGDLVPYKNDSADIYISNGCLNKCSFCKTTYQQYPLKSIDIDVVKYMIDICDEEGIKEVLLRGTNISQFGLDNYGEYRLPELIEYIEQKKNISRVGLIGFGFADAIHNDFSGVMRNSKKICDISGSLESGSDKILKLIRKGFTSYEFVEFINYISEIYSRKLRLNIIAGFPTETLDDVRKTLDVLNRVNPSFVGICRYTDSNFVDSHKYEQLSPETIQTHTRIYSKVLSRRMVQQEIVGDYYVYNDKLDQFGK